jgi:CheY-like chemotaxis protein
LIGQFLQAKKALRRDLQRNRAFFLRCVGCIDPAIAARRFRAKCIASYDKTRAMNADSYKPAHAIGKTVLVIDDNEIVRRSLAGLLEHDGYQVVTASNGKEAIECLYNGIEPDVIVLDMMMPPWDGWWFLARREQDPALLDVPVLMCHSGKHVITDLPCRARFQTSASEQSTRWAPSGHPNR